MLLKVELVGNSPDEKVLYLRTPGDQIVEATKEHVEFVNTSDLNMIVTIFNSLKEYLTARTGPSPVEAPPEAPEPLATVRRDEPTVSVEACPELKDPLPDNADRNQHIMDLMAKRYGFRTQEAKLPFSLNKGKSYRMEVEEAKDLNALYETAPQYREPIVKKIAGLERLNMLQMHGELSSKLRRSIIVLLTQNLAEQRGGEIPSDFVAFLRDEPLSETLLAKDWNPATEHARDNVSKNWAKSLQVQDKLRKEIGEDIERSYKTSIDLDYLVQRAESLGVVPEDQEPKDPGTTDIQR